ncbi:MAG: hypothetical protein ACI311_04385 [Bacilli bacterium]
MINKEDLLFFTKENIEEAEKHYKKINFSIDYLNSLIINALFDKQDSLKGKSKTLLLSDFQEAIQKGYEVKLDADAFKNYFINNKDFRVEDDKISLVDINDFFLKTFHLDLNKYDEWGPHNNLDDLLLLYANSVRELGITDNKSVALIFIMRYKQEHSSYENIAGAFLEFISRSKYYCSFSEFKFKEYGLIPTDAFIENPLTRKILFINGITHMRDFNMYDKNEIQSMLMPRENDYDKYFFYNLSYSKFFMQINYTFTKYKDELTQKIIYLYNGFLGEPLSLAEIAKRFSITIKEVLNRIDEFYKYYNETVGCFGNEILAYFYNAFDENKTFCSCLDLEKSLKRLPYNDQDIWVPYSLFYKFIFSAIKYGCYPIKYDKDLDIIYDSTSTSVDNIIEERIMEIGKVLRIDELENLSKLDHIIVDKYYFKRTPKLFAKKKMNDDEILQEILNKETKFKFKYYLYLLEENFELVKEYLFYNYGEIISYLTIEKATKLADRTHEWYENECIIYDGLRNDFYYTDDQKKYIQISGDTVISKEMLKIPNNKLDIIRKNIRLLVARFGEYNPKEIENHTHGYPHLSYPWNKYLLASIVSTYFSDEFEVVRTSRDSEKEDLIIKLYK